MRLLLMVLFVCSLGSVHAQVIVELQATLPEAEEGLYVPVSVNLDEITFLHDSALTLVEKRGNRQVPVPFQVEQGNPRRLHWLITPLPGATKRTFQLLRGNTSSGSMVTAERNNGALTISSGGKNLLRYQYGTVYPPGRRGHRLPAKRFHTSALDAPRAGTDPHSTTGPLSPLRHLEPLDACTVQ